MFTAAPYNRRDPISNESTHSGQIHMSGDVSFGNAEGSGYLDDPADLGDWADENFNISDGIGWFWDPSWDHLG